MYHHSFAVKERVDFVDNFGNCYTGSVDVALDEMVKCVSDVTQANPKPVVQYIGTETDQLAPPLTITASEKRKMHSFYLNLLKAIKPEEQ